MKFLISCAYNMDTGCVELKYTDGSRIAIDCTAVENEVAGNLYQRSELDFLIYNDSAAYVALIVSGDQKTYQKKETKYSPFDTRSNPRPLGGGDSAFWGWMVRLDRSI